MSTRLYISSVLMLTCTINIVSSATSTGSGSKETSTGQENKLTTQATTHATTQSNFQQGIMDIPIIDFSKIGGNSHKSGLAAIPTMDMSKFTKPKPPKSCSTNMCEMMNGICNNGTCMPQDCQSEIVCECYPGYAGPFCDRNVTLIDKAKEVPMLNGKIVSTETPKGKNGNGSNGTTRVNGTRNSTKTTGNSSTTVGTVSGADPEQVGKDKYKHPNGSFIKGPEVPAPDNSKSIKVNVKNQRVKDKSTMIIQTFKDTVTISTVSVNLAQSMTFDVSGQTVNTEAKPANTKVVNNTKKGVPANTGTNVDKSTTTTDGNNKKSQQESTTAKQNASPENAKNVDQVVLSQGKVPIVDKKIKSVGWMAKPNGRKPSSTAKP